MKLLSVILALLMLACPILGVALDSEEPGYTTHTVQSPEKSAAAPYSRNDTMPEFLRCAVMDLVKNETQTRMCQRSTHHISERVPPVPVEDCRRMEVLIKGIPGYWIGHEWKGGFCLQPLYTFHECQFCVARDQQTLAAALIGTDDIIDIIKYVLEPRNRIVQGDKVAAEGRLLCTGAGEAMLLWTLGNSHI